jgi:hypothetical protein
MLIGRQWKMEGAGATKNVGEGGGGGGKERILSP